LRYYTLFNIRNLGEYKLTVNENGATVLTFVYKIVVLSIPTVVGVDRKPVMFVMEKSNFTTSVEFTEKDLTYVRTYANISVYNYI